MYFFFWFDFFYKAINLNDYNCIDTKFGRFLKTIKDPSPVVGKSDSFILVRSSRVFNELTEFISGSANKNALIFTIECSDLRESVMCKL